jgi:hypothetical protein
MAGMLPAVGVGEKPHRARWPRAARPGSPLARWGPSHTCRAAAPSSVPRQRSRPGSQAGSRWITEDALSCSVVGICYLRMLTARAMTRARVTSEIRDCPSMVSLAHRDSGMTSVGLKAVALVKER